MIHLALHLNREASGYLIYDSPKSAAYDSPKDVRRKYDLPRKKYINRCYRGALPLCYFLLKRFNRVSVTQFLVSELK